MKSRNGRYITKRMTKTNHGSIYRREDKMFGGFDYLVFHPNGDLYSTELSFDNAMHKLTELRNTLKVW